ncbi:MAG: apolipoprotein N-acyltransferase [Alphaproteobacteria bacterium]|nr:MAG: apolipoprotein N-acyltransferase [Alphaproteobacteria bacterium]
MLFFIPRSAAGIVIITLIASGFWQNSNTTDNAYADNITLIQANIKQHEKWDPKHIKGNFDRYISMSKSAIKGKTSPQTIIWPETAISQNLLSNPRVNEKLEQFLSALPPESHLITGFLNQHNGAYYNSLIVMNTSGEIVASYDKHHLVPFGEYMPFGLDTLTGFTGFSHGTPPKQMTFGEQKFLPLMCYEVIFPPYSAQSKDSDFILNLTNDAWFGKTAGPYQHFDHARFRAAENKKPIIRLSGNGISAFIDSHGRVLSATKLNTQSFLSKE